MIYAMNNQKVEKEVAQIANQEVGGKQQIKEDNAINVLSFFNNMKNIHVIPTDKPSRLFTNMNDELSLQGTHSEYKGFKSNQNIYITSDEEIKEGDWYLDTSVFKENISIGIGIYQMKYSKWGIEGQVDCKKIVLTTDQDLIKDGVQSIDDKFLEWFVKNPSCEEVEVKSEILYKHKDTYRPYPSDCKNLSKTKVNYYLSIIPKEEPKQERKNCICKEPDFDVMKGLCKVCGNSIIHLGKRIEVSKQETLEEFANKAYPFYGDVELREAIEQGSKWQQERMYSEEEFKTILNKLRHDIFIKGDIDIEKWFEKFKKR